MGAPAPGGLESRPAASSAQVPASSGPLASAFAPRGPVRRAAAALGSSSSLPPSAQVPAFPGAPAGAAAPSVWEHSCPTGPRSSWPEPGCGLQPSTVSAYPCSVPAASGSLAGASAPSGLERRSAQGPFPGSSGFGTEPQVGSETRAQILASFPAVPDHLLVLCEALTLAAGPTEARAHRAWVAGCWARAVLDGRVRTPNRTPPIQLAPRAYVVLRAAGIRCPALFRSRRDYFAALGTLEGSDSVSHAWPSEAEARVYLEAAGFLHFQ